MPKLTKSKSSKSPKKPEIHDNQRTLLSFFPKSDLSENSPKRESPNVVPRVNRLSLKRGKLHSGIIPVVNSGDPSNVSDDDIMIIEEVASCHAKDQLKSDQINRDHKLNSESQTSDALFSKKSSQLKSNRTKLLEHDSPISTCNSEGKLNNSEHFSEAVVVQTFESSASNAILIEDNDHVENNCSSSPSKEIPISISGGSEQHKEPYYHKHFQQIIDTVLKDEEYFILFNETDRKVISSFQSLPANEQNLYIRMFQRKHKWLRPINLKYPEISDDLSDTLNALVKSELLQSESDLLEVKSGLNLLLLPELKLLTKHFGIALDAKGKQPIIDAFLLHCQQQSTVNRFFNTTSIEQKIICKIKTILGPCYRLETESRKVFIRFLLLFSLYGLAEDEEDSASGGQQKKLVTLLMIDKGQLKFPDYTVVKAFPVFPDRDSLIRFETAKQLEIDILNCLNSKSFTEAHELYLSARELCNSDLKANQSKQISAQPSFLRRFSSGHVYIRCLNHGVDILQRLKLYQDAVDLLWILLYQKVYCQEYRGHWWDRLSLILDYHLKAPKSTLTAVRQALTDNTLQPAHLYTLRIRALKLFERMKKEQSSKNEEIPARKRKATRQDDDLYAIEYLLQTAEPVQEAPKITIVGRLLPGSVAGYKNVFVMPTSDMSPTESDVTLLSVEELALEHYRQQGYVQGIHGEGSTFVSLFGLLFWNVIYGSDVPDVFRSPYQAWPLDLNTECFYSNRSKQFQSLLKKLQKGSIEDLEAIVESCWTKNNGTSSLVNWDLFSGPIQVKGLVRCLGNTALAGICDRLARNFRHCRSGVPDLVVWNPETGLIKVVEVKGPNDRLSPKQVIWLHFLLEMCVPVEVCHVHAIGSKKLKV